MCSSFTYYNKIRKKELQKLMENIWEKIQKIPAKTKLSEIRRKTINKSILLQTYDMACHLIIGFSFFFKKIKYSSRL